MTSRRLAGLGGLALAAADRSHSRQASLLDPWRLSTPQIHLMKLAFEGDHFDVSGTSPSPWRTVAGLGKVTEYIDIPEILHEQPFFKKARKAESGMRRGLELRRRAEAVG